MQSTYCVLSLRAICLR